MSANHSVCVSEMMLETRILGMMYIVTMTVCILRWMCDWMVNIMMSDIIF